MEVVLVAIGQLEDDCDADQREGQTNEEEENVDDGGGNATHCP
jgi:hypothetical protein